MSAVRKMFAICWNLVTRVRVALSNILFLLLLVVLYLAFADSAPEPLPEQAALLLNPVGSIVDQKSYVEPIEALLSEATPSDNEVLLRDVIHAIDMAAMDPAINSLVLELDSLMGPGISKSQEIVRSLEAFKATGKPVIAVGDYYTQGQYFLASHADTIILHPMGSIALEGFSSYRNYFRGALEKMSVNMHVFKAGDHKSMAEPFLRDDMSGDEKEITAHWLQNLWQQYTRTTEEQRELPEGAIDDYINGYAEHLALVSGDGAQLALQSQLADKLLYRSAANKLIIETVGAVDEDGLYEAVAFDRYIAYMRPPTAMMEMTSPRVAVITAAGTILPGDQPPGSIGGDSLANLIRGTAEAEGVEAMVIRVDSGGGSVFASEVIRQALLEVKSLGIPVVVSMGSVAASGGYYIAAQVDEIWATPATITGSIGVFAAFPTFERLLERLGVSTDGVGTTDIAGSFRIDRPLEPQLTASLNASIEFTYREFVQLVATGRQMSFDAVDAVAQGRVWSADDALQAGLVDQLGDLKDAIDSAAALAQMQDYDVEYVELPLSAQELFLTQLVDMTGSFGLSWRHSELGILTSMLRPVTQAAREISALRDPGHLYVRCVACASVE